MKATGMEAKDFKYAVFHQPNAKFPQRVAGMLGFTEEQIKPGLLCAGDRQHLRRGLAGGAVGHAGRGPARRQDPGGVVWLGGRVGCLHYRGHGRILERRGKALSTQDYIARRTQIDYATYTRFRGKINLG